MTGDITATTVTELDILNPAAPGDGLDGKIDITTLVDHIVIHGDVASSGAAFEIDIDEIEAGGLLELKRSVNSGVGLRVTDMTAATQADPIYVELCSGGGPHQFSGTLTLTNGIPQYAHVIVYDGTASESGIDLTNDNVAGELTLANGGQADILNGGAVSTGGGVQLAVGSGDTFTGTATFASVDGFIRIIDNAMTH